MNPDDDDIPPVDDVMPDAGNDNGEWQEVEQSGKGKTKKQHEAAVERKKAKKEARKTAKNALQVAQAAAEKELSTNPKPGTPRAGTTGPTRKKYSLYSTSFILNNVGKEDGIIPDIQRHIMKAVFSVGNDLENICFEPLYPSTPAPPLFDENDPPWTRYKKATIYSCSFWWDRIRLW